MNQRSSRPGRIIALVVVVVAVAAIIVYLATRDSGTAPPDPVAEEAAEEQEPAQEQPATDEQEAAAEEEPAAESEDTEEQPAAEEAPVEQPAAGQGAQESESEPQVSGPITQGKGEAQDEEPLSVEK